MSRPEPEVVPPEDACGRIDCIFTKEIGYMATSAIRTGLIGQPHRWDKYGAGLPMPPAEPVPVSHANFKCQSCDRRWLRHGFEDGTYKFYENKPPPPPPSRLQDSDEDLGKSHKPFMIALGVCAILLLLFCALISGTDKL